MGILIILAALVALMYLAYRGMSLLLLTPLLSLLAVLLSGEGRILANYTQVFMTETGAFIISFFPLFLLGAVFGKLMDASGSARALAEGLVRLLGTGRAIPAVVIACAVMTYGGVSLFVVAFAVYPIAAALFHRAGINKALIPATIALGAFTFTMSALPGTPSIQNAIPMPFFGTTPFAAPGLGVLTAAVMYIVGRQWLYYRARQLGAGYGPYEPPHVVEHESGLPSSLVASLPLVLVIALNLVFTFVLIPRMDTSYLATPLFGETDIEEVRGIWSIIAALFFSILALIALNWGRLSGRVTRLMDEGAEASLMPIFNTASLVGFGSVIATLAAFAAIRDEIVHVGGDNVLVSIAIGVTMLSAMTGSASGGMSIALTTLGDQYLAMAEATGVSPELLHRVTAVAAGSLDTLPHNGAVISLLAICGLTHRDSYKDLAIAGIGAPVIALIFLVVVGSIVGSF
ncbi:GntP family permease [Amaricoccus sp.]|uniref:GntP family permease n=1 Tax=Amaricoccus sp. TaxID=1872485 RepID=UPI001B79064A|nr:GntP family permease [Amaricoccus sp.]MBP7242981.1 GntP family permease [Amaricoccus sp.]